MTRTFSTLSLLTIILIMISGGGIYWIAQSDIRQVKTESSKVMAKGLAIGISSQLSTLQSTVSKMAATTEVITAVASNDALQMTETASRLQTLLPNALKIRILPVDVSELDQSSVPHMGNADLIMAQETLKENQPPAIQGAGDNRHLAITAVIKTNGVPIGIILASLNFDFLQSTFEQSQFSEGFIELKQGNTSLAEAGNSSYKTDSVSTVEISQSSWTINYWPTFTNSIGSLSAVASAVIIPAVLACLAFLISYRILIHSLKQDQATILKAFKNLIYGKKISDYPVNFNELKTIIPLIIQFKRALDNKGSDAFPEISTDIEFFD